MRIPIRTFLDRYLCLSQVFFLSGWICELASLVYLAAGLNHFLQKEMLAAQTSLFWYVVSLCLKSLCLLGADHLLSQFIARTKDHFFQSFTRQASALGVLRVRALAPEYAGTLTEALEQIDPWLRQFIPALFAAAFVPPVVLIAIMLNDPLCGLVLFVTWPLVPIFSYLIGRRTGQQAEQQWQALSQFGARFFEALQGFTTLHSLGAATREKESLLGALNLFRSATMTILRTAFLSAFVVELTATLATALVAVTVGLRLLNGTVQLQPSLTALLLTPFFFMPLKQVASAFHAAATGKAAWLRLQNSLEPSHSHEAGTTQKISQQSRTTFPADWREIQVEGVRYCYPGAEREVLHELNLSFSRGKMTAIVGASGAGKSTLISLLLRFAKPDAGRMTLDKSFDLKDLEESEFRSFFSFVPQDPHIFAGSLRDNVQLANPLANDAQLEHAARMSGLDRLIARSQKGWNTLTGEGGSWLSSGERQRVALARAFLHNAPVLVCDEPTACLDPQNRLEIILNIRNEMRNKTCILIAHQRDTLKYCDRIVALEHGHIVHVGTPASWEHFQRTLQEEQKT